MPKGTLDVANYPTLLGRPKYGYIVCETCSKPVPLKLRRDVGRKKTCSKDCRLQAAIRRMQKAAQEHWQRKRDAPRKVCKTCKIEFPQTHEFFQFGRRKNGSYAIAAYCRICHSQRGIANVKRRYGSVRNRVLMQRYGISLTQFESIVGRQGGVCAICRIRVPSCVDHNHITGEVRGALCNGCNAAIGNLLEDKAVFLRAMAYLGMEVDYPVPIRTAA